ncbi:MAG: FISUMP domain-containing protein [Dysgonomonas sp.]|nr:FISUMP domain-containing protein [Dysgonomonas sp.]
MLILIKSVRASIVARLALAAILLLPATGYAQVTIGSNVPPNKAAILDVKENANTGVNAKGGIGVPRVALTEKTALYPMFSGIDGANYKDAQGNTTDANGNPYTKNAEDAKHTGLIVYNTEICNLDGGGLYLWTGSRWQKLIDTDTGTESSISLSTDMLFLPSGEDLRTLESSYTFDVSWSGTTSPAWSFGEWEYNEPALSLTPASPLVSSSPQTMTLVAKRFSVYNSFWPFGDIFFPIENWPFNTYQQEIIFTDKCGPKRMVVNQTNKAIKVNGTTNLTTDAVSLPPVEYTKNAEDVSFPVESNARWKMTTSPEKYTPITLKGAFEEGKTYGTELYNNTSVAAQITYDLVAGTHVSQYAQIIFSDAETPARFAPIIYQVKQCNNEEYEITMRQWADVWEEMYGLDDDNDEPDSDGDITKNINRVQWHKDQNGNIFFSALFNGVRWMTSNLAATSFVSTEKRTATDKDILFDFDHDTNYPSPYLSGLAQYPYPVWCYPSGDNGDKTRYNNRERLGRLYNWAAATNSKGGTTGVGNVDGPLGEKQFPENTSDTPIAGTQKRRQGICPAGWHLPSDLEWTYLFDEIQRNTTKYADVSSDIGGPDGANNGRYSGSAGTVIDICEPKKDISSKTLLHGGFNALMAGYLYANQVSTEFSLPRTNANFWTSSTNFTGGSAHYVNIGLTDKPTQRTGNQSQMFSIRCVKD